MTDNTLIYDGLSISPMDVLKLWLRKFGVSENNFVPNNKHGEENCWTNEGARRANSDTATLYIGSDACRLLSVKKDPKNKCDIRSNRRVQVTGVYQGGNSLQNRAIQEELSVWD